MKIRSRNGLQDYYSTLESLSDIPYINNNIAGFLKVYKHGGYESAYVEGVNLKALREKLLYGDEDIAENLANKIITQLRYLIANLEAHHDELGHIPGDWILHNLIYDEDNDRVVNVDLEGFYTYKKNNFENNLNYLRNELNEIIDLLDKNTKEEQIVFSKVLAAVKYTATRSESYCGKGFESAYHSLKIKDKYYRGQRECKTRLENIGYNFKDKNVLDLGCNVGGMLHALSGTIKFGVGIDFCHKCINAANLIRSSGNTSNLSFYHYNLETEDLRMIQNFLPAKKVDICFLLSVCMWIENWREVIGFCSDISKNLLFEANGSKEEQIEQIEFLESKYSSVKLLDSQSLDDPLQKSRKLYLCEA